MARAPATGHPAPDRGMPAGTTLPMIVIMTGVLITAVDTTIVVLALPEIERTLHVAITSVVWVVIGYLLVITLLATQVGRLGDMFGRVRMYEASFAVFVAGPVLCALAWNEASIIGFRIVQGVGGAFVTANSGAVIADLFPPERRSRVPGRRARADRRIRVRGAAAGRADAAALAAAGAPGTWRARPPGRWRAGWPARSAR